MAIYNQTVMDHFMNPRNVGSMDDADGIGEEGNPVCGDIMTFYIKVEDDRIADVKFKTFGCGAAIAVSSMVSEMAKGKTLEEAMAITNKSVAAALEGLPPQKLHCSNLGADALHKAIEDYIAKHPNMQIKKPERSREEVYEERFGGISAQVKEVNAQPPEDRICCPYCEAVIERGSKSCEPCGRELGCCPSCGEPIKSEDHDCPNCGAHLDHN